ncbi:hypothetical protein C0581_01310 [Candidatus Parcubacteria bacterium]|nr:MAG: hypothetical protein C0581_01310 [Candidatus Parcubacteria bacterium]
MPGFIYPDQEQNRAFILTWEGMSFKGKEIDLLVDEDGEKKKIGSIVSKEELENGKEFDYNGLKIQVQHKKIFAFIKELSLEVNGSKIKGQMLQ